MLIRHIETENLYAFLRNRKHL